MNGYKFDLEAAMPGHVRIGEYLVVLDGDASQVKVLCRRTPSMPWHSAEYLRTIKPQSQNWKRAVKAAHEARAPRATDPT